MLCIEQFVPPLPSGIMSCCFTVEQFTLHMQICSTKKKLSLRVAKPLTNDSRLAVSLR